MPPTYLLAGKTGVGKSSFVNATFGVTMAPVSDFEACTKVVRYFARSTPFGDVCLIDTPGLAEDEQATDLRYLNMVRRDVDLSEMDAMLYVSRLDETRMRPEETAVIDLLTERLGAAIWRSAWFVLTFAASVPRASFDKQVDVRVAAIREAVVQARSRVGARDRVQVPAVVLLVDNRVGNWHEEAIPIADFLTGKGAASTSPRGSD